MTMSRRAKRMEKQHKRRKALSGLNMVALMDIFTILVFFLLVNQTGIQPQGAKLTLPKSTVEKVPADTLVITVNNQDIVVQGRKVAEVDKVMATDEIIIPGLQQELAYLAKKTRVLDNTPKEERPITIMGDREIPYKLLKRIMLTCTQTGYSMVSLAVTRTKGSKGAAS